VTLPVVLDGGVTWCHTLIDIHTLKMFKNRVLRRIFQPKRDEEIG
jgi:hypothetical protein